MSLDARLKRLEQQARARAFNDDVLSCIARDEARLEFYEREGR